MIIKEIQFFLEFAKELKPFYDNANPDQQRQILTVLKTWLFYNSSSKNIFWTGRSSAAGMIQRVKEHQYSNLSSVKFIMNDEIGNVCFFELSKQEQFKKVFSFMQWNYTSKEENNRLRKFQDADIFFGPDINGDPAIAYKLAEIKLITEDETADMMPQFNSFVEYENNQQEGLIFEIDLTNQRLTKFIQKLKEASRHFGIELQVIQVSKKGCIYRLSRNHNNFADLYRVTMFSLWKCFRNTNEIEAFLNEYNYVINENGPYRNVNNFKIPKRAFSIDIAHNTRNIVYLDTYNDITYKHNLMSKILDYFDANCVVYDFNLKQQNPII
jgi:hypothetical protein